MRARYLGLAASFTAGAAAGAWPGRPAGRRPLAVGWSSPRRGPGCESAGTPPLPSWASRRPSRYWTARTIWGLPVFLGRLSTSHSRIAAVVKWRTPGPNCRRRFAAAAGTARTRRGISEPQGKPPRAAPCAWCGVPAPAPRHKPRRHRLGHYLRHTGFSSSSTIRSTDHVSPRPFFQVPSGA